MADHDDTDLEWRLAQRSLDSTEPRGKHVVQFCESAPCHVMGGRKILPVIQEVLGLKPGQTSDDGKWTLLAVSCPGVCGVGPVMMVDDEVYGNLTPERIADILRDRDICRSVAFQYRAGGGDGRDHPRSVSLPVD